MADPAQIQGSGEGPTEDKSSNPVENKTFEEVKAVESPTKTENAHPEPVEVKTDTSPIVAQVSDAVADMKIEDNKIKTSEINLSTEETKPKESPQIDSKKEDDSSSNSKEPIPDDKATSAEASSSASEAKVEEIKSQPEKPASNVEETQESANWQQREQELLKKIEELETVKNKRSEDGLKLELKVREEEIDLLKARVKNLETELQAALSKPGGKNHEMIEKIKQQHEELLSKARGMIFDKTKMVKNQELQIEALTTQVQSLKDINLITKDLLEIRNSEVKAMEERLQVMEARFKAEKERYELVLKRAQTSTNINHDLRTEYETQLKIFKELREKYDLRVQALVDENNRLKGNANADTSGPSTYWCINEIETCNPSEGRRLDGSCNNIKYPSRGAQHTPHRYVLPLVFDKDYNPRKSKDGSDLPTSRKVRTTLLLEGRVPDEYLTHLVTYFSVFMSADVLSFHDTVNFLQWKLYCCDERGKTDPECIRLKIHDDDPVHRFSNERCFNLTRPWTFQSKHCLNKNTPPERIVSATPLFDLSQVYGDDSQSVIIKKRLFIGGLLKFEIVEGRMWPPSFNTSHVCISNQLPRETRCHDIGDESSNGVLGTSLFTIWMWRHHNYIANELARINPCWSDDKLFYSARDINIAIALQIFYYELNPLLLGETNLYKEGILSPSLGFRDIYDEMILPQISNEYPVVLRWMHTIQENIAKMYDSEGHYVKSIKIADLTLRTGYLADQNNIDYLTQGAFRQPTGKIDNAVDPDIAEKGLGPLQRITDLTTSDLAKNRYLGIAPYIEYRRICFGEIIKSFDDLIQAIYPEKIELLKELYKHVEDIDLMAGMWVERPISGARVPATFYCLVSDQLTRSAASDRHWYERQDRPHAFTIEQLFEIRKSTMAGLLCEVGDKVSQIQPNAFLKPGIGNEICSCNAISKVNLHAWKENECNL